MKYALGVDVGGTNIRIAVVDENGQMIRVAIYDRNKYAEEYSIPIGYQDCFANCFGLADYGDLPMGWK